MNIYMATPDGQALLADRSETASPPDPLEVEWKPATIPVAGSKTTLQVCDLQRGWWAAVGRAPDAVITIDSRGVPLDGVQLERVPEIVVPALSEMGAVAQSVAEDLDTRFERLPLRRVRALSDYWALRSVEFDHVHNLARRLLLSDRDRQAVQAHWLARIDAELADTTERLHFKHMDAAHDSRIARHLIGRNSLCQLWSNTLGPWRQDLVREPVRSHPPPHLSPALAALTPVICCARLLQREPGRTSKHAQEVPSHALVRQMGRRSTARPD